jgi:transposase
MLMVMHVCGLIRLYFVDETGFTMQPYVPYAWQKKGCPIAIQSKMVRKRLNILGFLGMDNSLRVYQREKSLDSDFVLAAIEDFLQYQKSPIPSVLILDNAPIHRAGRLLQHRDSWENQDLYLFFLPTYSPHLNRIEILWRFIKYKWLSKKDYFSWKTLKKAIFRIIQDFGSLFSVNFNELDCAKFMSLNSA